MGCVVNDPVEVKEADLGVANGNGQIFVRGQIVKTVPESQIIDTSSTKHSNSPTAPKWRNDDLLGSGNA